MHMWSEFVALYIMRYKGNCFALHVAVLNGVLAHRVEVPQSTWGRTLLPWTTCCEWGVLVVLPHMFRMSL